MMRVNHWSDHRLGSSDPSLWCHPHWPETGITGMGSLGGGKSVGFDGGVTISWNDAGSTRSVGVIGAASGGGATGSEAAGAVSMDAGAGAGAGAAGSTAGAAAGAGASGAGAAWASGMPRSVFGFSGMCAAFFAAGGRNSSTSAKKRS